MARKKGYSTVINQMARASARAEREKQQQEKTRIRELEAQRREVARREAQRSKEAKQQYLDDCLALTEAQNLGLQRQIGELETILQATLEVDDAISFQSLRRNKNYKQFQLPVELTAPLATPELDHYLSRVVKPTGLNKLVPGATKRYEDALKLAEEQYQDALKTFQFQQAQREQKIRKLKTAYERARTEFEEEVDAHNQAIDEFERDYRAGEAEAVIAYCNMVLERSEYPEGFPQEFRTAYLPESKDLIVEYELPDVSVIPTVAQYTYVKSKDTIQEKGRKEGEVKALYQDIVAAICLRTVHELFEADQPGHLEVVAFNGFIQTIDEATGKDIRPHLISIRTTRERFSDINLARVDKRVCLRNLGAQVSPRPAEHQPVKPVVNFDMVDKRFVEKSDVLADIESRPNLMELSPFEFENFISNLFDQIGFQSKLTRASKDGGVDVVAFDPRPIVGGKIVIQAKRYRNVVGVSAVRDLYGTMINEGAGKGILVTTSHYGPDAYDFAKDKPIELIDGGGLLYLLKEQGIEARIIFPEQ